MESRTQESLVSLLFVCDVRFRFQKTFLNRHQAFVVRQLTDITRQAYLDTLHGSLVAYVCNAGLYLCYTGLVYIELANLYIITSAFNLYLYLNIETKVVIIDSCLLTSLNSGGVLSDGCLY